MKQIVCAAFIEGEKILLVRRAPHRKWSPHLWDLVGGHVEKGEELDVALVRECQEEVGLTPLAFSLEATLLEDHDDHRKQPFYIYTIRSWNGQRAQLLGSEHSELGWFTAHDISNMELALPGYRAVIAEILAS
ncbi:NUDIX hydrolase [Neorhizobium alkalisoli]|uniref:8-oxo-dGTP diphosphatase n=1 Tax=Neorhizobium alkalisoli TaxID=528178 RepID=A0A561QBQ0_9HYPH|nr:NUDIX hydrolase [Neorhizobium alkalisoli]TWF47796.1 8-oxo-dGTP diphosphatase [Neorhizobium alkalisoli]